MVERFTPDIERGSSPDCDDPVMRPDEFGGYVRFSDYEAQIAGHRRSAKDATKNLIRATTAEAQFEEMTRSCIAERASRQTAESRADALAQEVERLKAALAEAGESLDWAARKMKGNCSGSEVNAVMLAAGRTADARAALANEEAGR